MVQDVSAPGHGRRYGSNSTESIVPSEPRKRLSLKRAKRASRFLNEEISILIEHRNDEWKR